MVRNNETLMLNPYSVNSSISLQSVFNIQYKNKPNHSNPNLLNLMQSRAKVGQDIFATKQEANESLITFLIPTNKEIKRK